MEVKHASDMIRDPDSRLILTVSRRTDMPAFYLREIVDGLTSGAFHPKGPYTRVWELRFRPDAIHSVHLWSQNFGPWITARPALDTLGYSFFYRFTILPDDPFCKPHAPPLDEQLRQLRELAAIEGPDRIDVAVDPIVRYCFDGVIRWNLDLETFARIADGAAEADVGRIRTSFVDAYRKLRRRQAKLPGFEFDFFDKETDTDRRVMIDRITPLAVAAADRGLRLETCCELELTRSGIPHLHAGACVDGGRLNKVIGPGASTRPDRGQRKALGCLCTAGAVDVGRYDASHACGYRCPQCYAMP